MNNKLGFVNKLGYGLGDFAFNLSFQGTAIFLLVFYTDVLGIEAETAGLIFLIATIWDAVSDPIMGFFASRTHTKWGKYRPYLLFTAIPLGLSYIALFYQPVLSTSSIVAYALITHILFRTFFTIGNIPYSSLATEMSYDESERSDLAGFRIFLGMAGALIVGTFTPRLLQYFGGNQKGYLWVAILSAAIAAIVFIISFLYTKEEKSGKISIKQSSFNLADSIKMISGNWPFWLLFAYMILGMGTVAILTQSLNYYFTYKFEDPTSFGNAMFFFQGAMMVSTVGWVFLAKKISKRNTLIIGSILAIIGGAAFFLNLQPSIAYINICLLLIGSAIGCGAFSFWSMLPDTVEYGEWKSGVRAEAVIAALGLFSIKISLGLGAWLLGMLLSSIGYVPNTTQTPETLSGLHNIASLTPLLGFLGIATVIWFYPIDAAYHRDLLEKLESRKKIVD